MVEKIDYIPSFSDMDVDHDNFVSEDEFMDVIMRHYAMDAREIESIANRPGGFDIQQAARQMFYTINSNKYALREELSEDEQAQDFVSVTQDEMKDFFRNTHKANEKKSFSLISDFNVDDDLVKKYLDSQFKAGFYEDDSENLGLS